MQYGVRNKLTNSTTITFNCTLGTMANLADGKHVVQCDDSNFIFFTDSGADWNFAVNTIDNH